jgi:hypothetical protein
VRELYRVLEVEPTADFDTIRESYRRLLKRYHPDSGGPEADAQKLDIVIDAFKRLSAARSDSRPAGPARRTRRRAAHSRESTAAAGAGRASARRHTADAGTTQEAGDLFGLGRTLTTATSISARTFAARSLGNLGKRSAFGFLKQGLEDPEPQVVIACLRAIGRLKIAHSAGALSAVFNRSNAEVRRVVMETVAEINRLQLFRNLILAGLEDDAAPVRQRALKLFMKLERQVAE